MATARQTTFEFTLGPSIAIVEDADPTADVVFLPSNAHGSPGQLNSAVLRRLGLPALPPTWTELARGYAFPTSPQGLVCFVVTVGSGTTEQLLATNLGKALVAPELVNAGVIWLP